MPPDPTPPAFKPLPLLTPTRASQPRRGTPLALHKPTPAERAAHDFRDPEDPTRYAGSPTRIALVTDTQRADMELWAHTFHLTFGRPMRIPVALYDTLKASGVDMRHMEPTLPHVY